MASQLGQLTALDQLYDYYSSFFVLPARVYGLVGVFVCVCGEKRQCGGVMYYLAAIRAVSASCLLGPKWT
jgi:hypothetical protein